MTDLGNYQINGWAQPIHLFAGGAEETVCGMGLRRADNQSADDVTDPFKAVRFPASNNFDTMNELKRAFIDNPNNHYCAECAKVFVDD